MIDLYFWPSPNARRVTIMLAECALPYRVVPVDISAGAQFDPEYEKICPNNRIPAIQDPDGPSGPLSLFDSGAILLYLAEKTGKFLPADPNQRLHCLQWLFWQMSGMGPIAGQLSHFTFEAPGDTEYTVERLATEFERLLEVMERPLAHHAYLAGEELTIADIATWPWVAATARGELGVMLEDAPAVQDWFDRLTARPGFIKGRAVGADLVG
ncbi:MAG: glutathione S-transferase family protein [Magnetospiraceae bacterium]